MRLLTLLAGLLVVAVVAAEIAVPPWAEGRAEERVAAETDGRVTAEVKLSGPPLVVPVLLDSTVDRATMRLDQVGDRPVPLDVVFELDGIEVDRMALLSGNLEVTDVEAGVVRVRADLNGRVPAGLEPVADQLAELGLDRLLAAAAEGAVRLRGGRLEADGLDVAVDEASCTTTAQDLVVTIRCRLAEIPPFLVAGAA